jgi:hypothetical protein
MKNTQYFPNSEISQYALTDAQGFKANNMVATYLKPYQGRTEVKNLIALM